jgi:hypothetical protein
VSNYNLNPAMCRVDVWKESGKWYETIQVEFLGGWPRNSKEPELLIHDAFEDALRRALKTEDGTLRLAGMRATCLEPYHVHSHPISVIIPER